MYGNVEIVSGTIDMGNGNIDIYANGDINAQGSIVANSLACGGFSANNDGSGSLASGGISWDTAGDFYVQGITTLDNGAWYTDGSGGFTSNDITCLDVTGRDFVGHTFSTEDYSQIGGSVISDANYVDTIDWTNRNLLANDGTTVNLNWSTPGVIFPPQSSTAPTYVKGAIYFDTTLNKLRVGGATGWETVTSV